MKYIDTDRQAAGHIPSDRRPLGYWLRAIEGPLRDTMRNAFATFGVTRREWRTLATLHAGPASVEDIRAAMPPRRRPQADGAERAPRPAHPRHPGHRTLEQLLESFVNRGWATLDRGSYALTAEGERIHDAVLRNVQTVRAQVTAGIPDADYATTMSTLEKIAGNVGFDPAARLLRRRGHGHGAR